MDDEVKRLRDALGFYAIRENYGGDINSTVMRDRGEVARKALERKPDGAE